MFLKIPGDHAVPFLDEAPAGSSEVDHNSVFNNDFGIETDTQTGLDISHNDVFNNVSDAITICGDTSQGCGPATQNIIRANNITNNGGSGLLLLGADSNLLKRTISRATAQQGSTQRKRLVNRRRELSWICGIGGLVRFGRAKSPVSSSGGAVRLTG